MILHREKTIELRRRAPRRSTDFWLGLYATAPERAVIGVVRARDVIVATPEALWTLAEGACGLGIDEYRRYYEGANRAVGIWLEAPIAFPNPVSLDRLRNCWPGFHPPRSFAYLSHEQRQQVWDLAGLCLVRGAAG